VFVFGLLQFGLLGVTIGMSLSAVGVAAYAVRGMHSALGIPLRELLREIWPPTVAGVAMAGALFPLEHLVVHASSHGAVLGLILIAGEALLGIVAYMALMGVIAPHSTREFIQIARDTIRSRIANRRLQRTGAA
jgi:PST family polysaccharide transporter